MNAWSAAEVEALKAMHGQTPLREIACAIGRSAGSVRGQITKLGIGKKEPYPEALLDDLREAYRAAGDVGFLGLESLAAKWGKDAGNLSRKAGKMGLATSVNRRKVSVRKPPRARKFQSDAELSAYKSQRMKEVWRERPHPRGALGMRHTEATKLILEKSARAAWESMTDEKKESIRMKAERTRRSNGNSAPKVRRGKWYAGWREIGGSRVYFRSRWEANYARYLEWLRAHGNIASWEHEPQTFWFEGIRRGAVSYLPDFRVTNNDGSREWHEVKGWMDARSATVLKRMAKYFPSEKMVVIREKDYRQIQRKVAAMIPGWESEAKRKDWAAWTPPE